MKFKKIMETALCFLLLFNFSRYVPDYKPEMMKEIKVTLPDNIAYQIEKDATEAAKRWKEDRKK